jgi:ABC-type bacteriocin/lantibiotic exporter with double-glycine peptidase domain
MREQTSRASCGPFALLNALKAIGIERTPEELETLCKTSMTDGTDTPNMVKGAAKIDGCTPIRIKERRRDVALLRLRFALTSGRPVVLSWCEGSHWVAAIGVLGERYLICDSDDLELVLSYQVEEVAKLWVDEGIYEGVVL